MNRRQRITIFIGSLIIAAMLLFPPMSGWRKGYGFIFNKRSTYVAEYDVHSPTAPAPLNGWVSWYVNRERLVLQVLIVVVLTGGIAVMLGGKRE